MMIKLEDVIFMLGHDLLNDLGTGSRGQIYPAKRLPSLRHIYDIFRGKKSEF